MNENPARPAKEDRHFVTALARGMEVLACFRAGDRLLGNQEIAQRCRLPKSTVSRLTYTLTRLGYLNHVEELGKYRLGVATFALSSTMVANLDVNDVAGPLMQELADFARAEVALGARDRLSMVYLVHCRSKDLHNRELRIGSRLPLAVTSMGRAWLAGCEPKDRDAVLRSLQDRRPRDWPRLSSEIDEALQQHRRDGHDGGGRLAGRHQRHCAAGAARQRSAAAVAQLRRPRLRAAAGLPAAQHPAAPDRAGGAHRNRHAAPAGHRGAYPTRRWHDLSARRRRRIRRHCYQ